MNSTHDILYGKDLEGLARRGSTKKFCSRSDVEKVEIFWKNLIFFILSWVRIELMTSQSLRVLSKGDIKDVKEPKEHISLSVICRKSWNLLRKFDFFDSVMRKNWNHDLLIFKGAFERVNQGCKRANRTHFALGQMRKKLKSSEKIWFFHSVMSKNWTHDLPILRVLSKGEIKDVKEQENTFSSRSDVEKVEIFWENWIFSFCHE